MWSNRIFFILGMACAAACHAEEMRMWSDPTGRYELEAELVSSDATHVTLKSRDGQTRRVQLDRLSEADRKFLAAQIFTYREFKKLLAHQRDAHLALNLLKGFIETPGVTPTEKQLAVQDLPEWQARADRKLIRAGNSWVDDSEFQRMRDDEIRLIKEAHRLIDIKSDDVAKERFLEASKTNPESVRANFYLGLLNALVVPHPGEAEKHFRECVERLARDGDQLRGVRKANYVAALNNYAVIQVRKRKHREAIATWRRAIEIAPYTPELVQNLGLMVKLAQTATYVRIPRVLQSSAAGLYAKVTVENNLGRFDDRVGWLFIPYVDTLDGSIDETGDEEFVTVGWCNGFAVGANYVLTSRYPLIDADRVQIRDGTNIFEIPSGKVVAISDRSNLALLQIDGLSSRPFPLSTVPLKPAQDVTIVGYRERGFTGETFQRREATILDLPNVFRHANTSSFRTAPRVQIHWFNYRDMVLHDAIASSGMEGAPLINQRGAVAGVHLGNRAEFGSPGEKFSFAEPSQHAIAFLKPILGELTVEEVVASDNQEFDSQKLRQLEESSIFQLAIQKRAPRLAWTHRIEKLHRSQRQGDWISYEDKTCMACNGGLTSKCRNCNRGSIARRIRELKYTDPNTGVQVWGERKVTDKCGTCGGEGHVTCRYCNGNGVDQLLR